MPTTSMQSVGLFGWFPDYAAEEDVKIDVEYGNGEYVGTRGIRYGDDGEFLFDSVGALIEYLEFNIATIIGSGNYSVNIYRDNFPSTSKSEAVSVFSELTEMTDYGAIIVNDIRINTRAREKQAAYNLAINVNSLLNRMVRKMLSDDIELVLCKLNSGPSWFRGEDGLHYYTILYGTTMRQI